MLKYEPIPESMPSWPTLQACADRIARERAQREGAEFDALPTEHRVEFAFAYSCVDWLTSAERVALWRSGRLTHLDLACHHKALLRVRGQNVETSHGARFPIDHAKRAWRLLRLSYACGEAWRKNGDIEVCLGDYRIYRVDLEGTVYAGCDIVAREEIERLAAELGLEPVRPRLDIVAS